MKGGGAITKEFVNDLTNIMIRLRNCNGSNCRSVCRRVEVARMRNRKII